MKQTTKDGLVVVTEDIFMDFLRNYDISSAKNDPELTRRIERENPQIYRILRLGMQSAPTIEA